ncbi:hypothetical protein LX36DRAFT_653522 [Colletotrichum falcatum]|nr:hypothetical protein LX36DRAFT_653522 [Colletotrichum falcatum]
MALAETHLKSSLALSLPVFSFCHCQLDQEKDHESRNERTETGRRKPRRSAHKALLVMVNWRPGDGSRKSTGFSAPNSETRTFNPKTLQNEPKPKLPRSSAYPYLLHIRATRPRDPYPYRTTEQVGRPARLF